TIRSGSTKSVRGPITTAEARTRSSYGCRSAMADGDAPRLAVDVGGGLRLQNPVIAASGTFGYGVEFAGVTDLRALGAIVVKGLSLEPSAGHPAPRLVETAAGMMNAIGLQNIGVRAFVETKLPQLRASGTAVVANFWGN